MFVISLEEVDLGLNNIVADAIRYIDFKTPLAIEESMLVSIDENHPNFMIRFSPGIDAFHYLFTIFSI